MHLAAAVNSMPSLSAYPSRDNPGSHLLLEGMVAAQGGDGYLDGIDVRDAQRL